MRIAALQMQSAGGDVAANIARIAKAATEAAEAGAKLLITPELCITGYGGAEAIPPLAEPADGAIVAQLGEIAQANGLAIVAGFAERDGDTVYNSAVFTDGRSPPSVYRKSNLYGDYEHSLFTPEQPATCLVRFGGITFGMLICYDVEFPENVRRLAVAGADMVLVPTALPRGASGSFIAGKMIQVRAFENQVFVAYINHTGQDERFGFAGLSRIAAPDGSLLAEAPEAGEVLLVADIRPEDFRVSKSENTYLKDMQPGA